MKENPCSRSACVRENLPKADLVFDPFHVMKLMNDKLDKLRRELWNNAPPGSKTFIKNSRWILLKGNENLSERPNPKHGNKTERQRLDDALAYNQPLAAAYYLKESLRLIWDQVDKAAGKACLESWMAQAGASGIEQMAKMAESLRHHQDGILAVAGIQSPTQYMGGGVHMTCMIACAIGGGSFGGGKGSVVGALFGVVFISLLTNMFNLLEMNTQLQNVVVGLTVIAIIVVDGYLNLKKMRDIGKA